jgi:hypothetical protein
VRELQFKTLGLSRLRIISQEPTCEAALSASGLARIARLKTSKKFVCKGGRIDRLILERRTERRTADTFWRVEKGATESTTGEVFWREREELEYFGESRVILGRAQRLAKREHLKWTRRACERNIRRNDRLWQRAAEERREIEEERQRVRIQQGNYYRWQCHRWYRQVKADPAARAAGTIHPPWWKQSPTELVTCPFRDTPQILPLIPRCLEEREIFHQENCTCPISHPCYPESSCLPSVKIRSACIGCNTTASSRRAAAEQQAEVSGSDSCFITRCSPISLTIPFGSSNHLLETDRSRISHCSVP